jgi:hypothetical protein
LDVVDVDMKAGVCSDYDDDEYWKGCVIGKDKTDRRYGINDQPTDQAHSANEQ